MAEDMLNIQAPVHFDESIANYEFHVHQPYGTPSFEYSDEKRIIVQNQDLCILPSKSYLHVTGKLMKVDGNDNAAPATAKFVNYGICHLFEEIRYEMNGIEIDKSKNVGITSLMKACVSFTPNHGNLMMNAGWIGPQEAINFAPQTGHFDVSIPLSNLLGFAEDYQKIIVNAKHELILIRARNDSNAIIQTDDENVVVTIMKIEWVIPYVTLSDSKKISLLNFVQKDPPISMSFRSWELYEYPMLPQTMKHVWSIKTSTQLEKPRYVILGFQTARKHDVKKNASNFDHCNILDVKLFLNSQYYPYGNLNCNMNDNEYALLYDMYANFQSSYYDQFPNPLLDKHDFLTHTPLIVIDCSKQNEALKSGPVDVRLEFEARRNFPANTAAYCLILHDRIVQYHPISGGVRKIS